MKLWQTTASERLALLALLSGLALASGLLLLWRSL